jgi:hypothetical protein
VQALHHGGGAQQGNLLVHHVPPVHSQVQRLQSHSSCCVRHTALLSAVIASTKPQHSQSARIEHTVAHQCTIGCVQDKWQSVLIHMAGNLHSAPCKPINEYRTFPLCFGKRTSNAAHSQARCAHPIRCLMCANNRLCNQQCSRCWIDIGAAATASCTAVLYSYRKYTPTSCAYNNMHLCT